MNRFSSLLKIKKEDLRRIEILLQSKNNQKNLIFNEIESLYAKLKSMQIPKKESFGKFTLFKESIFNLHKEIEQKREVLKRLNEEIEEIKSNYQKAQIEFEKIKYIQEMENKKILETKRVKEQKELDEISSILFGRIK